MDSQRPVDFLIALHIAGRRKYTGTKKKREVRDSMPENGELGRRNMKGKRNNRTGEESDKGRENETVKMRRLAKRRKAEKHNCWKGKEREMRGRVRQKRSKKR